MSFVQERPGPVHPGEVGPELGSLTGPRARGTMSLMGDLPSRPVVLAVGGLDPTGGAGLLADVAAIRSAGAHGAAVVAVSTVQDGETFAAMRPEDPGALREAVERVLGALDVRAVKVGALGSAANAAAMADLAGRRGGPPVVVDPVMRSTSGGVLLEEAAVGALLDELLPRAALATPNADEAAALAGVEVRREDDLVRAAEILVERGVSAVLVKGGHLEGPEVVDVLLERGRSPRVFRGERLGAADGARGTGCALAALAAAHLAFGASVAKAVERARRGLRRALEAAVRVGQGPPVLGLGWERPGVLE